MQPSRPLTPQEIAELRAWAETRFGSAPPRVARLLAEHRELYISNWLNRLGLRPPKDLAGLFPALRGGAPGPEFYPPPADDAVQWESGSGVKAPRKKAGAGPAAGAVPAAAPAASAAPSAPPAVSAAPAASPVGPATHPLSYHQRFLLRLEVWRAAGGPAAGPLPEDEPGLTVHAAPGWAERELRDRGASAAVSPASLADRVAGHQPRRQTSAAQRRFATREQVAEERRNRREQRIKTLEEELAERVGALHELLPRLEEIRLEQQRLGVSMAHLLLGRRVAYGSADEIRERGELLSSERVSLLGRYGVELRALAVDWDCAACQNTGWLPPERADAGQPGEPERFYPPQKCDCLRREELEDLFRHAGIQGPQHEWTFDSFSLDVYPAERRDGVRPTVDYCRDFAAAVTAGTQRQSLVLAGPPGVGKTHLACAVAHEAIAAKCTVVYLTMTDFLEVARMRTLDLTDENREYLAQILNADLLILDDLGAEKVTEYSVQELTMMLNHRINNGLPMLITTNLPEDEVRQRYGDRIYSRMVNGCEVLVLNPGVDVRSVLRHDRVWWSRPEAAPEPSGP